MRTSHSTLERLTLSMRHTHNREYELLACLMIHKIVETIQKIIYRCLTFRRRIFIILQPMQWIPNKAFIRNMAFSYQSSKPTRVPKFFLLKLPSVAIIPKIASHPRHSYHIHHLIQSSTHKTVHSTIKNQSRERIHWWSPRQFREASSQPQEWEHIRHPQSP